MTSRRTHSFAAILLGLALAPSAFAATATASLPVTATVISACSVSSGTLNFGSSIDATTAAVPIDATGALTVLCTNSTTYSVSLDAGSNAGGATNFTSRMIKSGTHTIGYQLYTDSGRTTVWGNGTGSSVSSGTGTGSNQALTVYGRMPSVTGAYPGTYTDTVTVTITY